MFDSDAMRVLEDGDLETLGRVDYGAQLDHPFTAHPKLDPITGLSVAHHTLSQFLLKCAKDCCATV